jgi:hypothetical protein
MSHRRVRDAPCDGVFDYSSVDELVECYTAQTNKLY